MTEQVKSVRGRIQFRVRKPGGWGTGTILPQGVRTWSAGVTFVGVIPEEIVDGDLVEVAGEEKKHPRWGNQFEVQVVLVHYPSEGAAVVEWMIERLPQIGPERAEAIVKTFGATLWDVLEGDYLSLTKISGITEERAKEIHAAYVEHAEERQIIVQLIELGLTATVAGKAVNAWRNRAMSIIEDNPYKLFTVLGAPFDEVDRIALNRLGVPKDDPRRIEAFVMIQLQDALDKGDCSVLRHTLVRAVSSQLKVAASTVQGLLSTFTEVVVYDKQVVLSTIDRAERTVASTIRALMEQPHVD